MSQRGEGKCCRVQVGLCVAWAKGPQHEMAQWLFLYLELQLELVSSVSESCRRGCSKDSLKRRFPANLSSQVVCFMIKGKDFTLTDLDLGFKCATYKLLDAMAFSSPH